jgi:hypothetical protein
VVSVKDLTEHDREMLHNRMETVLQKGSFSLNDLLAQVREIVTASLKDSRPRSSVAEPGGGVLLA